MRKILISLIFLLLASNAIAANLYVRDGGESANCTSWSDACDQISTAHGKASRGDTIYVASGTYDAITLNKAVSGTTYIYIKKATVADHGTDTGWSNDYATGQAVIAGITLTTAYYDIDGATGTLNSGHGIKIVYTGIWGGISALYPGTNKHHYRLRHIEVDGTGQSNDGIFLILDADAGDINDPCVIIEHCHVHNQGGLHIHTAINANYIVIQDSFFDTCCQTDSDEHKEMVKDDGFGQYWWIRRNVFKDWRGYAVTGGIILSEGQAYWYIYNNLFYWTGDSLSGGNRAIGGLDSGSYSHSNIHVYNNTFYNISQGEAANVLANFGDWTDGDNKVYNNLWISCAGLTGIGKTGVDVDYNAFYATANYSTRAAHDVSLGSSPVVNAGAYNFALSEGAAVIDAGANLSAIFADDYTGAARSLPYDIGAYEYGGYVEPPEEPSYTVTVSKTGDGCTASADGEYEILNGDFLNVSATARPGYRDPTFGGTCSLTGSGSTRTCTPSGDSTVVVTCGAKKQVLYLIAP